MTLSATSHNCQVLECLLVPGHQEGAGVSVASREVKGLTAAKHFSSMLPCQENQAPLEIYRCRRMIARLGGEEALHSCTHSDALVAVGLMAKTVFPKPELLAQPCLGSLVGGRGM